MSGRRYDEHLPPRELWPDLIFTLPNLQYPDTLNVAAELLDSHVTTGHGSDIAVVFKDRRMSYGELQQTTNRIGNVLRNLGVAPGDRVAMRFPNRPIFVAAWLAVQKIGAVGVATMPMLRARELAYIVNDSAASVFLCAGDLIEELEKARAAFVHPVQIVAAGMDTNPPSETPPARP